MMTPRLLAAAATACLFSLPGLALAEASRLHLILGGEAYDGPPRFEVSFNGQVLGEGVVEAAIDTATAGRFADAADKTPYVQSFEFAIPEERPQSLSRGRRRERGCRHRLGPHHGDA